MMCNYVEYQDLTDKLFYGIGLTDGHLNYATEKIRRYLINGGAGTIVKRLGIGIKVTTKQLLLSEPQEIYRRFVWLNGNCKGKELDVWEIKKLVCF